MRLGFNPSKQERIWLVVVLTAGLINGLLHTYIVPPWQHYDEPGHFEYAWLIANRSGLPEFGEYDQSMRREVAASMIEHGFFTNKSFRPNLLSITEPVWIGISQTDDVPLYYLLVSVLLSIFRYSDVTFQLYLGRLVSLGLFLITILGAYAITAELTSPGHSLRILIPATVALIPSFADIMSAVNNDAGAAAFFTLFLWVCVRMIRRKITWLNLFLLIVLIVLCIFTKSTTIFVIPLAVLALLMSLLPRDKRVYTWIIISISVVLISLISLTFNGIASWREMTPRIQMSRTNNQTAPIGEYFLEIKSPQKYTNVATVQLLPYSQIENLKGRTVTVGAWMWASSPIQTRTPILEDSSSRHYETVSVGTTPAFFTHSFEVADRPGSLLLYVQTSRQPGDDQVSIFFDGVVLVEGDHTQQGAPSYFDMNGSRVEWGTFPLSNYLRNASFEKAALRLRPQVEAIFSSYLPIRLSNVIGSFFDLDGYRSYYSITFQYLFRTFWAIFGWGDVYLIGSKPYRILLIITLIALVGFLIYCVKRQRELPIHDISFLGFALFGVWGMAAIRGVNSVFYDPFIPSARYAYPVIVPTVLILVIGWREILNVIGARINISKVLQYVIIMMFLMILNGISLYSIWLFYHPM